MASSDEQSVLTAVQLLWVNLIMEWVIFSLDSLHGADPHRISTFAALALATDPADPESLKRKPDRKTAPLSPSFYPKRPIAAESSHLWLN